MKNTNNRRGFTLIELLVVVLIIGILAAVAVPQYQKAVEKSRNAEMKQVVKAVADAERVYYLANGKYAANFSELDLDLPLQPVASNSNTLCAASTVGDDSARRGKNYYVVLNSQKVAMPTVAVVAYRYSGKYKCAGFGINLHREDELKELHCRERKGLYTAGADNFCKKIEQGERLNITSDYWRLYRLPL